jgi:class 3 adenylate cyclase
VHLNKETAVKPVKSVSKAERKQVTALFSDITGYTAITGRIDPEDVKEITGRIFQGAAEIVSRYGGFIEGFVGDGMLVLFGVPKSHGDDPVRAIHSAREIHELVVALSPQYEDRIGVKLSMHSGVNTGLAVAGEADSVLGTHGVTGDVINVASRLSDLARPYEIIVGFDTYRACRSYFSFKPLNRPLLKVKPGKSLFIDFFPRKFQRRLTSDPAVTLQLNLWVAKGILTGLKSGSARRLRERVRSLM